MNEGRVRLLRHPRSFGQSASVQSGVYAAKAPLIAHARRRRAERSRRPPGDARPPRDGAERIEAQDGDRQSRHEARHRGAAHLVARRERHPRLVLHDGTPDSGCGIKVFDRETYLRLPFFDHMHRFLSALFLRAGARSTSVPVAHRPRTRGTSKYGIANRLWAGIVDILGVMWLRRRGCPDLDGLRGARVTRGRSNEDA